MLPHSADLDLNLVRVQAPAKILFLCGGPVSSLSEPHPKSLRDAFLKVHDNPATRGKTIIQAEDVNTFEVFDNHYSDLLKFETDLAQITELILLFCESEGSLAELGAFSMVPEIASRLLVVVRGLHWAAKSFVKLGPLRALEKNHGATSVFVVDDADIGIARSSIVGVKQDDLVRLLTGPILDRMAEVRQPTTFDRRLEGHTIKLLVGLIQEYAALTIIELSEILGGFGLVMDKIRILSLLYCAESVGWVHKRRKGSETYFVARDLPDAAYQLFSTTVAVKDKSRRRSDIREFWQKTDPSRFAVISESRVHPR